MAGIPKPSALDAFSVNLADARSLLALARCLRNGRSRRMRRELRERIGSALKLTKVQQEALDCVESQDLFIVVKPGSSIRRSGFTDEALAPMLRQIFVITCAAVETYAADRAMELLRGRLTDGKAPQRVRQLTLQVGQVLHIEANYQRRKWGYRQAIEQQIRRISGPGPDDIAEVMKAAGIQEVWNRVDRERGVDQEVSSAALKSIVDRRNRIAHDGDRDGRGRARISMDQATGAIDTADSIVAAIQRVTAGDSPLL